MVILCHNRQQGGHNSASANTTKNHDENNIGEKIPTPSNTNSAPDDTFRTPQNHGNIIKSRTRELTTPSGTKNAHSVKDRIFRNQLFYKLGKPSPTSPADSNNSALRPSPIANSTRLGSTAKSVINQLSNQLPPDPIDSSVLRKAYNMNIAKKRNHPDFNNKKGSRSIPQAPPISDDKSQMHNPSTGHSLERGGASEKEKTS